VNNSGPVITMNNPQGVILNASEESHEIFYSYLR
jgi:hypothetical protein